MNRENVGQVIFTEKITKNTLKFLKTQTLRFWNHSRLEAVFQRKKNFTIKSLVKKLQKDKENFFKTSREKKTGYLQRKDNDTSRKFLKKETIEMRKQRIISQMKEKIHLDVKFHVILNNNFMAQLKQ